MGSGTLQKTVVSKHSSSLHLQMKFRLNHAKRKNPETLHTSLDLNSSETDRHWKSVLWSDSPHLRFIFEINIMSSWLSVG